jgi:hypothetical protein
MRHFCTLFDSNYLNRGLVMHQSLMEQGEEFHLFIFPFDDLALQILTELRLPHVTLIPLADFENSDLLRVKPSRSKGEYCWTCTPYTIEYVLDVFRVPQCTYLDADLCFFSKPGVLLDEMKDASVLITEHRYTPEYDQSSLSGIYCVQFLSVKDTAEGRTVLSWWRDRCLEWCYSRVEDGKFGDQKYLDDWTTRFRGVHVLKHLGGGVAPWNIQQYELSREDNHWWITLPGRSPRVPLVFYHFHYVKFLGDGRIDISPYRLSMKNVYSLYAQYLRRIAMVDQQLAIKPPTTPAGGSLRAWVTKWRRMKNGTYNVFRKQEFNDRWPD